MTALRQAMRVFWIVLGVGLMALGLVGAFLPTHILGLLLVLGLVLVLRNSVRARRRFVRLHRRHPRFLHPVRRLLRRKPEFWPVVWHEALRAERARLAKQQGVPPYVVFQDVILRAMATVRPQTLDDMMSLPGIGEAKLRRYGEPFLAVITGDPHP